MMLLTTAETVRMCRILDQAADIAAAVPPPADPGDGERLAAAAELAGGELLALAGRIHEVHQGRRRQTQKRRPELPPMGRVIRASFDPAGGGDDPPDDPPDDEVR